MKNQNKDTMTKMLTERSSRSNERSNKKNDSTGTVINNPKISDTLNTNILSLRLRSYPYKRAESELRQILNRSSVSKERTESIHKSKSISRNSNIGSLKKTYKKLDSALYNKDANIIIDEYRNISKPEVWESVLDNLRANPKQLLELIPISLTTKNSTSDKKSAKTWNRENAGKKLTSRGNIFIPTVKITDSMNCTPDIVETLKEHADNMTEDWARSLLHHNIKQNNGEMNYIGGFKENELNEMLKNIPSNKDVLATSLDSLFITLEHLLMELLGTKQDFMRFKEVYNIPLPSIIRSLAVRCIDLFTLRNRTKEIIEKIIIREKLMKRLVKGDKKGIIEIHKISNFLREKIKGWLKDKCVPFKEFLFKGRNYIEKMEQDLVVLQEALNPLII
ncbi:hypothetical protein SteCoe_12027 [Stentor coeruleus]|uniref:Uncharacterized protein n=1 Tax=Stentor coeruleus TaxID=5963 RepID=A0A1R2CBR6_9CILI|nr:hypothetical protein SteCoe_12027 [Stentor coeruleus]